MTPDYNRLYVFYQVMTAGGVSAAANTIHVSQSAVSQHLAKLEAEIGTPLFTRLQNRLVPTDAARRLFAVMTPFVRELEQTIAQLHHSKEAPYGVLRIGAPVEFGVHYLPRVFASFRKKYPSVQFELIPGHPAELMPRLEKGELNFSFIDLFSTPPQRHSKHELFHFEKVVVETLALVTSTEYFKSAMNSLSSLEALLNADYVTYQENAAAIKSWFSHHYKRRPIRFNVSVTVESVQGVKESILAGLGAGVLPLQLISKEIAKNKAVLFSNRKRPLTNAISLASLLDKKPTLTEKTFMAHLRTELSDESV